MSDLAERADDDHDLMREAAAAETGDEAAKERLAAVLRRRHRYDRQHPATQVLARVYDVAVDRLGEYPDGFAAVHRGDMDGFIIRGVLTPDEAATFAERLAHTDYPHENMGGQLVGMSLLGLEQLDGYFPGAAETRRQLDELFGFSFEQRVEAVFEAVGGGRPASLPRYSTGEPYLPATVRILDPELGGFRAHTGNEFVESYVSYDHLRSIARVTDALSYFVQIQRPDVGGELVLYDLTWDDTPAEFHGDFMSPTRDARLEQYDKAYLDPGPGDMILFNGGRIWHKVADLEGTRQRVTVGGFTTISRDDRDIYYWN